MSLSIKSLKNKRFMSFTESRFDHVTHVILNINKKNNHIRFRSLINHAEIVIHGSDLFAYSYILFGLPPLHAYQLGKFYFSSQPQAFSTTFSLSQTTIFVNELPRYGRYLFCYQLRQHALMFKDRFTDEEFIMPLSELIRKPDILNEFDAIQSFYIGAIRGAQIRDVSSNSDEENNVLPLNERNI